MNILFSSTRQWNPGDEFILFGIRSLLDELGVRYNTLLYNRHPAIHPRDHLSRPRGILQRVLNSPSRPDYDNSYFLDSNPSLVDYVIFAGTPEWNEGPRIEPLLDFIEQHRIRCAFLGVGSRGVPNISESLDSVLRQHTDVIVARNQSCYDGVKSYDSSELIVCPAMFCAPTQRKRTRLRKLGLVVQDKSTQWHHVSGEVYEYCLSVYPKLAEHYPVELIAHYMDDLEMANRHFPSLTCRYSSCSEDYLDIYEEFDLIVSPRVHGSGLASSLAIPNILLPHDQRSETAELFGSIMGNTDENMLEIIRQIDVQAQSRELVRRKKTMRRRYLTLLAETLSMSETNVEPHRGPEANGGLSTYEFS